MNTVKNKVELTGKIGKLLNFKELAGGKKMARLSLGTTDYYQKPNGENVFNTEWHTLVAWGRVAQEMEDECEPGMKIAIIGKLTSRSYLDKENKKRFTTEVIVGDYEIIKKAEPTEHLQ